MTTTEQCITLLLAKWKKEGEAINAKSKEQKAILDRCINDLQEVLVQLIEEECYNKYFMSNIPSEEEEKHLLSEEADIQLSITSPHGTVA